MSVRETIVARTVGELRALVRGTQSMPTLVPTMGALHEGHLELVRQARMLAGDSGLVVVSVFVNPTQFGPNEDFDAYPRDQDRDVALCRSVGVDIVFAPPPHEIYDADASVEVVETSLSKLLCGASRPGHFTGVCLVVLKLFNIVQPARAVFGKKDYQQLAIIRRMVRDLNLDVDVIGINTVRESDGLAMSSRNAYLTEKERPQAAAIRRGLLRALAAFSVGQRSAEPLLGEAPRTTLTESASLGRLDYLELVDAGTMQRMETVDRPAIIAVAMFFGKCRLIDNIELIP